jgi:hypothetical protein
MIGVWVCKARRLDAKSTERITEFTPPGLMKPNLTFTPWGPHLSSTSNVGRGHQR